MEIGHTQNAGDSVHACIENKAKGKSIFTQDQWATLIHESRSGKNKAPYVVKQISQKEIFDFQNMADHFFNILNNIAVSRVREIMVKPNAEVNVKYDLTAEFTTVKVLKKNFSVEDLKEYVLQEAYANKIALNEKKKKDIETMIKKRLIPDECVPFYDDIVL